MNTMRARANARAPTLAAPRGGWPAFGAAGQRALILALVAAAAGCSTVGKDYVRPEVPVPTQWRGLTIDAGDAVNLRWWEAFGDRRLDELVAIAIAENKDLRVAVHRIEEYEARLQVARSQGKPQVGYQATKARIRRSEEQPEQYPIVNDPEFNAYGLGLTFSWEIDLWGRIRRSHEASLADLLATRSAQRGVMVTVTSGVASGYIELLSLDRDLDTARRTLANRESMLSVVKTKQAGGSATMLDVELARAHAEEAAAAIPEFEQKITQGEYALSLLLGRNPGPVARGTLDALGRLKAPSGRPLDLLDRRPDVESAEQALIAANARVGVAEGDFYPTISLAGMLGLASDHLKWLLERTARTGELMRSLLGTLYSAGQLEGQLKESQAVLRQKAQLYAQSVQVGLREVEDALVARTKVAERGQARSRQTKALAEAHKLVKRRYDGGQTTLLETLEVERQLITAQGHFAQAQRDEYLAMVALYKAMGGGWLVDPTKEAGPVVGQQASAMPVLGPPVPLR
jgi:outer membrane protein, multidrug efflux system